MYMPKLFPSIKEEQPVSRQKKKLEIEVILLFLLSFSTLTHFREKDTGKRFSGCLSSVILINFYDTQQAGPSLSLSVFYLDALYGKRYREKDLWPSLFGHFDHLLEGSMLALHFLFPFSTLKLIREKIQEKGFLAVSPQPFNHLLRYVESRLVGFYCFLIQEVHGNPKIYS